MTITLNSGQQAAVDVMTKELLSGDQQGLTLLGEGGTGKTTCVMWAVEQWIKAGMSVIMAAPTNKAVKQLESSARRFGLNSTRVQFMTLHKALGLAMLPDEENMYAAQVAEPKLSDFDILVLDEGSMVSRIAFMQYLLPELESNKMKAVIMGDRMQLPPVRESESMALQHFPSIELTKTERFSMDSDIAKVTTDLRMAMDSKKAFIFNSDDYPNLKTVKPAFFTKEVLENIDENTSQDDVRVLAWTNARVNMINKMIREKIYGRKAEPFIVGERVVTGRPITQGRDILLSTDEECIVTGVDVASVMDENSGEEYKTYLITLQPLYDPVGSVVCHVVHPDSELVLFDDLEDLFRRAKRCTSADLRRQLWAKYRYLRDLFSDLKYCYCITVHRSQGSTYQTVLVDVDNILTNTRRDERRKLLYVALSRASQNLITNKERFAS